MFEHLSKVQEHRLTLASMVLAVICFLSFNLWASLSLPHLKLDLTEDQRFTLHPVTIDLLQNLEEPISLRLYLSSDLLEENPSLVSHAARAREIMARYATLSGGQIDFVEIDPAPWSREEDRANSFGLEAVPLSDGRAAFFGLVGINHTDDHRVIPVLAPAKAAELEYDVTEMIYRLANPERPRVGVIEGFGISVTRQESFLQWLMMSHLRRLFDIDVLDRTRDWPEEGAKAFDALMVVHPRFMDDETLYRVEQFALSGKPVLVFTDPHAQVQAEQESLFDRLKLETGSNFNQLYRHWGLETETRMGEMERLQDQVIGDMTTALRRREMTRGRMVEAPFPFWMELRSDRGNFNPDHPITANLSNMITFFPGALRPLAGAKTQFTPLVQSTTDSMLFDRDDVYFLTRYETLQRGFESSGEPKVMAALVTGSATASRSRPENDEGMAPHLEETDNLTVLAVTDVDLLHDSTWAQRQGPMIRPFSGNADFVTNALEYMTGLSGMGELRSRGFQNRPFTRIEQMQQSASQMARERQRELETVISNLQAEITEIVSRAQPGAAIIELDEDAAQRMAALQEEQRMAERALRDVSEIYMRGIRQLQSRLTMANIFAVPLALLLLALLSGINRRRQRKAYARLQAQ